MNGQFYDGAVAGFCFVLVEFWGYGLKLQLSMTYRTGHHEVGDCWLRFGERLGGVGVDRELVRKWSDGGGQESVLERQAERLAQVDDGLQRGPGVGWWAVDGDAGGAFIHVDVLGVW